MADAELETRRLAAGEISHVAMNCIISIGVSNAE